MGGATESKSFKKARSGYSISDFKLERQLSAGGVGQVRRAKKKWPCDSHVTATRSGPVTITS